MIQNSDIFELTALLWGDIVSRLDSVLMEARHLQINIIRQMREPRLYKVLHYEEDYLWGGYSHDDASCTQNFQWPKIFKQQSASDVASIVRGWVIQLPLYDKQYSQLDEASKFYDGRKHSRILEDLSSLYQARNIGRGWGPDITHKYELLAATQQLKLNLVHDKALICFWGNKTQKFEDRALRLEDLEFNRNVGRFVTIRTAVIQRLKDSIERLEDIRAPLERELDSSIIDNPRPVTMRSRSQGFYNSSLNTRSRRFHYVQKKLLKATRDLSDESAQTIKTNVHTRWTHQPKSTFAHIGDGSFRTRKERDKNKHFFINTSFWMNDRPDLCPAISHEIAHDFIDRIFNDLGEEELKYSKGELGHLLRRLSKIFHVYETENKPQTLFREQNREILVEIGTDFIASMRNAHAYLWTSFLELVGLDLFELLEQNDGYIDLLQLEEMESGRNTLYHRQSIGYSPHLWSLRLSALCDWVEAIDAQNAKNPHAEKLVQVIRKFIEVLDEYIEHHTPYDAASGRGGWFLKELRSAFRKEICRHPIIDTLRKHQVSWRKTSYRHQYSIDGSVVPAEKLLPADIQKYLETVIRGAKLGRLKNLPKTARAAHNIEALLANRYHLGVSSPNKTLFSGLQDIPWVASVMRGIDYDLVRQFSRNKIDGSSDEPVFKEILTDFSPGHDLYALALEMVVWLRTRPERRLSRTARYIGDYFNFLGQGSAYTQCTAKEKEVIAWLYRWLTAKQFVGPRSLKHIYTAEENLGVFELINGASKKQPSSEELNTKRSKKLRELLDYLAEQKKHLPAFSSPHIFMLFSYLSSCSTALDTKAVREHVGFILDAFSSLELGKPVQTDNGFAGRDVSLKKPVCIAQVTQAGRRFYNSENTLNVNIEHHAHWLGKRKTHWIEITDSHVLGLYAHTLGRHDVLHITDASNFQIDTNIPRFDRSTPTAAEGPETLFDTVNPFSMRIQRGIPLLFPLATPPKDLKNLCATMHITLTGRDCRLDFLMRLRHAWNNENTKNDALKGSLEHAAQSFLSQEQDLFLLIEGTEDIMIMFFGDPDTRLSDIFEAQRIIRQDLLVEHVETSFSANVLHALGQSAQSPYSLCVRMRFKSDRNLNQTVTYIEDKLKNLKFLSPLKPNGPRWRRIPGRSDFILHISSHELYDMMQAANVSRFGLEALSHLIGADQITSAQTNAQFAYLIDEVETTIEYNFP